MADKLQYIRKWKNIPDYVSKDISKSELYEVYPDKKEQKISETQDVYLKYLQNGGKARDIFIYTDKPKPMPVIDKYQGLTQDQKIAQMVTDKLIALGYSQPLMAAIIANKIAGRLTEEFDTFNAIRMQCAVAVYQELNIPMPSGE